MSWRSSNLSEHLGIRICFSGGIGDGSDAGGFGEDAAGNGGELGDVGDLGNDVSTDMGGDVSADSYNGDAGLSSEGYGSEAGLSAEGYGSTVSDEAFDHEVEAAADMSGIGTEEGFVDGGMDGYDADLAAFSGAGLQPQDVGFVEALGQDTFTSVGGLAADEEAHVQLAQATQPPSIDLTPPDRLPDSIKQSVETVTTAKAGVDTPFGALSHDTQIKSHLDYSVTPGSVVEQSIGPDLLNPTPMEHIPPEELNLPSEITNHDALVTPEKLTQTLMNNENASLGMNLQAPGLGGATTTVGSTVSNGVVKSWDLTKDAEAVKGDQETPDTRVDPSVLSSEMADGFTAHQGFNAGAGTSLDQREFER